jgi:hypothetical protein
MANGLSCAGFVLIVSTWCTGQVPSGLRSLCIVSRSRQDRQLLQPSSQQFEFLACPELVQAVNADLNRSGMIVGDSVDVFGVAHGRCNSLLGSCFTGHRW